MSKFITKQDKPFFIGLFIMNIVLISFLEIFVLHPPDFMKKPKYKYIEKEQKNENSR